MSSASRRVRLAAPRNGTGAPGVVMVVTLLAVVVVLALGLTILNLSYSEDFNARRERRALLAFFAAEAGVHEALARMNLDPGGPSDDETEIKWTGGAGNPDSVRDPRMLQGNPPEPNPALYSDSAVNNWRFWNYDPNWRYSKAGSEADGDGNYPGATPGQQGNLSSAGRAFSYNGASARTLPSGSSYTVQAVPHLRRIAGAWEFVDERGVKAAAKWYYYKITSTGTSEDQAATAQVIVRKKFLVLSVPAAITAGGDVIVGGNASVTSGDPGDENPTGVAVQSGGVADATGSGTITGTDLDNTPFPGFEGVFGITPAEMQGLATIPLDPATGETGKSGTITYTDNLTTNPPHVPSGTTGATGTVIWITAKNGAVKKDVKFTGGGGGGYTIGSASQPVILVVDGNLALESVTIFGIIYVTGTFSNQGGSQIKGGILVEGTAETDILGTGAGGGTKIAYSKSVMSKLDRNSNLFPFRALKGTWKLSRG